MLPLRSIGGWMRSVERFRALLMHKHDRRSGRALLINRVPHVQRLALPDGLSALRTRHGWLGGIHAAEATTGGAR
jgi:hypothetical protein